MTTGILYVDDEKKSLKYFEQYYGGVYQMWTVSNTEDAYRILVEHEDEIGIVMADQRMPGEKGIKFLERVYHTFPLKIRMLVTAYAEFDVVVDAVNRAGAYKYVEKPWGTDEMMDILQAAALEYQSRISTYERLNGPVLTADARFRHDRTACLSVLSSWVGLHTRKLLVAVQAYLARQQSDQNDCGSQTSAENMMDDDTVDWLNADVENNLALASDLWAMSLPVNFDRKDQIELRDVLAGAVDHVRKKHPMTRLMLREEFPEDLPSLLVDGPKFFRLFEHLLMSGVWWSNKSLRLRVVARSLEPDMQAVRIQLYAESEGGSKGMPALYQQLVAGDDEAGLAAIGLRMLVAFLTIYHHGGWVEVEQVPSEKSVFSMVLPTGSSPLRPQDAKHDLLRRADLFDFVKILQNE